MRRAILSIMPPALLILFTNPETRVRIIKNKLPDDVKMVSAHYNYFDNVFDLILESTEFEDIEKGSLPRLDSPVFQRIED